MKFKTKKRIIPNRHRIRPRDFFRGSIDEIDEDKIVFYDLETDHQFAPYAQLKMIGVQYGFEGKKHNVVTRAGYRELRQKFRAPDVIKVAFNGINFDHIVCDRYGFPIHPMNHHDVMLMFKTIAPQLPAFAQKFIAFYYLRDPHFPEHEITRYCLEHRVPMHKAPKAMFKRYNLHDLVQLQNLFAVAWDHVIGSDFWRPYLRDMFMGDPLLEMETEGGIYLNEEQVDYRLHLLQKIVDDNTRKAIRLTKGVVKNPNSSKQLAYWFDQYEKIEMELTKTGEFSVNKRLLVELKEDNPVADCAFKIRTAHGSMKYYENYLKALADETYNEINGPNWIPVQFSVSAAATRRFTSQSLYRLNFQNPNEAAKEVQVVPRGYLGWWIDATQIENVVHIYESRDDARREAYEADPEWNEYVWLCNEILGTNKTKDELDDKVKSRSKQIPNWTIYKQYKTAKLAINFGMGVAKFCKLFNISEKVGREIMADIHSGCPAIKELQGRVAYDLRHNGFVTDVFGYRYTGSVNMAYKVVAYLIQGCGTGSLPKAQIRANWETLRRFDSRMPRALKGSKCGVMAGTTHDENSGRIDLRLGDDNILQLLQKLMYNMSDRFSPKFDNIPLRAKLYLSKTTAGKAQEFDIQDTDAIHRFINN